MMFKLPAHKAGTAAQIVNELKSPNQPSVQYPKYLYEEIARMEKAERPKLNFEQWWETTGRLYHLNQYEAMMMAWTAAQRNA